MSLKKITSLTLLLSGVIVIITSIILYIKPHGWVAFWVDWHYLGLSLSQWKDLHMNLGFLFLAASIVHLLFNWRPMLTYLKNNAAVLRIFTLNFNLALGLVVLVSVGTYVAIPPMSSVVKLGDSISAAAAKKYDEPPYARAELSSLKFFARKVALDLVKAKKLLQENGIKLESDAQSLYDLARAHNLTPPKLYEIMLPATAQNADGNCFPDAPLPGFGRKKLKEVCVAYELNLSKVVQALGKKGINVDQAKEIVDIGLENNVTPIDIFEIIHGVAYGSD